MTYQLKSAVTCLTDLPDYQVLDTAATAKIVGKAPYTMGRWRREGVGPTAVLLTRGKTPLGDRYGYRVGDLKAWLAERAAA